MTDATRILVAQMARVYLAVVGTAAPAGVTVAPAGPWREVGLFTPDSLAWATDPTFEEVRSHQSNYPTRRFQTGDAATVEVDLQEWSLENFQAVYGGGTVTTLGTAPNEYYKFSPPAIGGRTQVSAMLEIIDGIKKYRRIIPVAEQAEGASQAFSKTAESTLPLRLTVIGSDIGDPWYDLSNDPAFAAA
jgi:hypothetical protein